MTNTLISHLRAPSNDRPQDTFAHLPDGTTLSFADFFARAEQIATALVGLGLKPGDRVAVQVAKSIESLQLYIATVMAGGVFLPLNTGYTAAELDYFLGNATPHITVCDPTKRTDLSPVAAGANVAHLLTLGADGTGTLSEHADKHSAGFTPIARAGSDLAAILYTSGTTGRSKGAMLSHDNLWSNSASLCDEWQFSASDVLIHALPIFHTHGLFVATNTALLSGAQIIFQPGFDPDAIVKAMPQATALMGVPTFYTRLLKTPDLATASKNMRLFVSGSAPLLAETHDQWRAITGHAILERYGMTETNMNTSNPYTGERRAGTVGMALPGVEVKITDPTTGETMPSGERGMIEVRGSNVFLGYWKMPEKTAEELRPDGWFITGDIGIFDSDGYLAIVGRSKDLIISGGYNIYPKEIESMIDDLSGVTESAVIGAPHPDFGEGVIAIVVPTSPNTITPEQIQTAIGPNLARFKHPKSIYLVNELPRNTMGKVQKNILRETYKSEFKT